MKKLVPIITLLTALAASPPVSASSTPIVGTGSIAENGCVAFVEFFANLFGQPQSCLYNEASYIFAPAPTVKFIGPIYTGSYYARGNGPGLDNPGGMTPGGDKQAPVLKGKISISGSGPGAVIGGRVDVGPATFAFVGQGTDTGEATWKRLRYEIADKVADSATPNGFGGYTYVIGTQGVPALLVSLVGGYEFPSEVTSTFLAPGPLFWQAPGVPGENDTAGISTIAPKLPSGLANIGTTATASFQQASCTNIVFANEVDAACETLSAIGNDPDIDNLLMVIDTNKCGRVITGRAFANRETDLLQLPFAPGIDNWNATTWSFESVSADGKGCIDD